MEDLLYKVALARLDGVGAVTARQLLNEYGSAQAIFECKAKELNAIPYLKKATIQTIVNGKILHQAEEELDVAERYGIDILYFMDSNFPKRLKQISQGPIILYYKGNAPLDHSRTVGIIGTRRPTPFGDTHVERLIEGLSAYQPLIISGLAYGIDIAAHKAALQKNLSTIGVLGHGLRHLYPAKHRKIAEQMIEQGGLLTEYPFFTEADPRHFPMRNRIVAGLSDALVVIESPKKGGSIITAQFANDYNKDVFAIPGRLHDKTSEGCNWLIKTHRAALLESAEDITYNLRWEEQEKTVAQQLELFESLNKDEKLVVALLQEQDNIHIDLLAFKSKLGTGILATVLLQMELKGLIRSLPGKLYMLIP